MCNMITIPKNIDATTVVVITPAKFTRQSSYSRCPKSQSHEYRPLSLSVMTHVPLLHVPEMHTEQFSDDVLPTVCVVPRPPHCSQFVLPAPIEYLPSAHGEHA